MSTAFASGDYQYISGSSCQARYSTNDDDVDRIEGYIRNTHTTSHVWVNCPLPRDNYSSDEPDNVDVYYYNGHATDVTACNLFTTDRDSTVVDAIAMSGTAGVGFKSFNPSLSGLSGFGLASTFYVVECRLPDRESHISKLMGIYWEE